MTTHTSAGYVASNGHLNTAATTRSSTPALNSVSLADIGDVFVAGMRDFAQAPLYGLFFSSIYVFGGWFLILLLFNGHPYLVYPLAAGFAFIAPFVASGFYAISQRLECVRNGAAESLAWGDMLHAVRAMFSRDLGWMALVTGFSFFIWMDIAAFLSFAFVDFQIFKFSELANLIFTTPSGWIFLLAGNAIGAVLAFCVFSYLALSLPMLFDRDVDFVTAMATSVRFVLQNVMTMTIWCFVIVLLVGVSAALGFVGLFVVLPVIGHASWHLYRRAVSQA